MGTFRFHEDFRKPTGNLSAFGLLLAALLLAATPAATLGQSRFQVRFAETLRAEPFSGRVYVFFARGAEPRLALSWFQPTPILAVDVKGIGPGEPIELSLSSADRPAPLRPNSQGNTLMFPADLDARSLAGLKAQAVIRFNPLEREVGSGEGNGYSAVAEVRAADEPMQLVVDKLVPPVSVADTEWTKILRVPSKRLTQFHRRPVELMAAVRLPPSYFVIPQKRYPVIFEVPGFGGAIKHAISTKPYSPAARESVEFIHVFLDPNCPLGHHVFADSANNGPVGEALIRELIPALDQSYRTTGSPQGRFLTGHSSGGWSSLWLQVTYPEAFNGTWSTAPDPVDFRDFQRINLSRAGENMYLDPAGERRPIARREGRPVLWYDDFARMEDVLGPGGQLHSFEAVFSDRGPNGKPKLVWNRETGAVDTAVAETWKRYDIRLILEQNWPTLGPRLAGKLHVFMGDQDTFYLEGATKLLKESLEQLGSDAVVEIHPGKDHSTLMTRELRERITVEMSERLLQGK